MNNGTVAHNHGATDATRPCRALPENCAESGLDYPTPALDYAHRSLATIAAMPESPRTESPLFDETSAPTPGSPSGPQGLSRWMAPVALVVAIIAVAIAIWALVERPSADVQVATTEQTADAKARACSAFDTVRAAVSLQTHAELGTDPVAVQAVAANARLSMSGGSSYLLLRLEPATPGSLAEAIRSFTDNLQDISMNALAGVPNSDPAQAARLQAAETAAGQIADLCQ